jgi:hypothetical protein
MGCCGSEGPYSDDFVIGILGMAKSGRTSMFRLLQNDFGLTQNVMAKNSEVGKAKIVINQVPVTLYDFRSEFSWEKKRILAEVWAFFYVIDASDASVLATIGRDLRRLIDLPIMTGKPFVLVINRGTTKAATGLLPSNFGTVPTFAIDSVAIAKSKKKDPLLSKAAGILIEQLTCGIGRTLAVKVRADKELLEPEAKYVKGSGPVRVWPEESAK